MQRSGQPTFSALSHDRSRHCFRSHLYDTIKEHFPHSRRDMQCQRLFLGNTLKLLSYAPMLRPRTVHLIVERLVDLDVQIELQQQRLEEVVEEDADAIFEVELGDTNMEELAKMRKNAEKLDEVCLRTSLILRWAGTEARIVVSCSSFCADDDDDV